ncbi:zinc finger CCCH domain-containing protein 19-like [Impatiens glandulifera]|uniref:zinc finger CCCH domain-containing protein 19-like n=1 Tax=Impatiens glandulifera TaxID=253017 RepID=UPI001FB0A3F4|nr:zinc finger CCCH domain-containing protein 19-like [Impatiens glandulifera]
MDTGHSSASSTLPWIWVIEALAKETEVDMSVLIELAAKTPEISDEVGKDARNNLILRGLEDLNATGSTPIIEIDKLTDHEDMRQILTSEKFPSRNEGSDIQTLIQNIRRSLPKSALERIKDAICEGRHPILESLKKSSRLSMSDDLLDNHEARRNAVQFKGKEKVQAFQLKGKGKVHSDQVTSMRRKLPCYQSAHSNQSLQDPIKINHVSSQCKRIDPTSHDKLPEHLNAGNCSKDESDSLLHIAKKAKDAASKKNETAKDLLLSPVVSNELSENLAETVSHLHIAKKAKPAVSKKNEATKYVSARVSNELSENLLETDSRLHIAKKAKPAVSKKNEVTKDVSAMVSNELSENLAETDSHVHIAKKAKPAVSKKNETTKDVSAMVSNELSENLLETDSRLHIAKKAKPAVSKKNEVTKDVSAMVSNELPENLLETDSRVHIAKKAKPAVSKKNETTKDVSAMVSNELSENLVETTVISIVDKLDRLRSKEVSHDDGSGKNNFLKEKNNDHPIGPSVCSLDDRAKMKCVDVDDDDGETEGDSDGIDDEKIDIEIEKQRFLKSKGTFSEDTFSATQNTELNLCIKCNRDGQLLICKTRTCTISVHPSCLGYDAPSPFYCPFCTHSNAISVHLESKKESSLARESLRAFEAFKNESLPKRYVMKGKKQCTHNKHQKEPLESCLGGNQRSRRSSGVIDKEYVGSECETEHNLRGEQITKKQAHSILCREMVVINLEEDDDIPEDTNKPREK